MDLYRWRSEFPITASAIHLNHAAVSPLPLRTRRRMKQWLAAASELPPWEHNRTDAEGIAGARARAARLIGAKTHEIGFTGNTTQGMSVLANGFPWEPGDNVVIPAGDYPANVYPWMNLSRRGVEVRFVKTDRGRMTMDDIRSSVDGRTRIVSLSSVEFNFGYRHDLGAIAGLARERGIIFAVDAIQALGAVEHQVERDGIDFLAAGGFKWLLGPVGSGIVYCSDRIIDRIHPHMVGANSVANAGNYLDYDLAPRRGAGRYEEGSVNESGILGLGESLRIFEEIGMGAVEARIAEIVARFDGGLRRLGYPIATCPPPHRAGILSFTLEGEEAAMRDLLRREGIVATVRYGRLRLSPHFYITDDEVDRTLEVLEDKRGR